MDIYSRFKALPRARKGTTTVVIVEEDVLRKLIYDATWNHPQVSEQFRRRSPGPFSDPFAVDEGWPGIAPPPAPPGVALAAAHLDELIANATAARTRRGSRTDYVGPGTGIASQDER